MKPEEKEDFIHQKALENRGDGRRVYWSRHAVNEAVKDGLTRAEVETALETGTVIEDYPAGHRPLPDCLVLGRLPDNQPLHVVVAINRTEDRIFVVTVYLPSEERWQNDWRTRR